MDKPVIKHSIPNVRRNGSGDDLHSPRTAPMSVVAVDESKADAHYVNFCRLSATPEEVLLDFGLNQQPIEPTTLPTVAVHRVIVGWHTAKRLQHVLQETITRFETTFGALETDVQKRVGGSRGQD